MIALVAGATRGAGRGTAVALGEAGATVYCTGRSTREHRSEVDRPETIEETAELVTAAGGEGIAVEVDHLDPAQVARLVERIDAEHGRLDVLVNDIWGSEHLFEWNTPLWEHDLDNGLRMLRLALDTHLITSHHALPLLIRRPGGLVVEVTDGTAAYNAERFDHQQAAISYWRYLGTPDFWNRTLQNWQSEFLAVGSMAVLAIYLRQRGSPESKPVGTPHSATGVEG